MELRRDKPPSLASRLLCLPLKCNWYTLPKTGGGYQSCRRLSVGLFLNHWPEIRHDLSRSSVLCQLRKQSLQLSHTIHHKYTNELWTCKIQRVQDGAQQLQALRYLQPDKRAKGHSLGTDEGICRKGCAFKKTTNTKAASSIKRPFASKYLHRAPIVATIYRIRRECLRRNRLAN